MTQVADRMDGPVERGAGRLGGYVCGAALFALAPVLVNLHFGSVRVSTVGALIPSATAWGLGAVLVREVARWLGLGWWSLVLLGACVGIAEECVFLQTSYYPLLGVDPSNAYGRVAGVNWPYLIWAAGYESVFAVAVPIWLVESVSPAQRSRRWVGGVGLAVMLALFVLLGLGRWYAWTQVFLPRFVSASAVGPGWVRVAGAVVVVVLLVTAAVRPAGVRVVSPSARRPWPAAVWLAGCVAGLAWFVPLFQSYGVWPGVPLWVTVSGACAGAAVCAALAARWLCSGAWRRVDTLVLIAGLLSASAAAGFFMLKGMGAPHEDVLGKGVVNGLVLVGLCWLYVRERRVLTGLAEA